MKINYILILVYAFLLTACNEQLEQSKQLAMEAKKRKIGKIEPFEIVQEAKRLSNIIAHEADSLYQSSSSAQENFYTKPSSFRNYQLFKISVQLIDSLNYKKQNFTDKESMLFESLFETDNKLTETNIQKLGDTTIVAVVPIQNIASKKYWNVRIQKKIIVENIWLNK
jgi:hypothetical protein